MVQHLFPSVPLAHSLQLTDALWAFKFLPGSFPNPHPACTNRPLYKDVCSICINVFLILYNVLSNAMLEQKQVSDNGPSNPTEIVTMIDNKIKKYICTIFYHVRGHED